MGIIGGEFTRVEFDRWEFSGGVFEGGGGGGGVLIPASLCLEKVYYYCFLSFKAFRLFVCLYP